ADYASAAPLVVILIGGSVALTSVYPAGAILQGMGRFKVVAVTSISSGIANLALSIVLIGPLGVTGVALGTLVPTAIEALVFVIPYTMYVLHVSPRSLLLRTWVAPLLAAVPAVLVLETMRTMF